MTTETPKPANGLTRYFSELAAEARTNVNAIALTEGPFTGWAPLKPQSQRRDIASLRIKPSIATTFELEMASLVLASGPEEFLNALSLILLRPGDEVIVCEHSLSMCREFVIAQGAIPVVVKSQNFKTSLSSLVRSVNSKTKMVCLASPNATTGSCLNVRSLYALRGMLPPRITLVLDFSVPICLADERFDTFGINFGPNTITFRSLPKLYGLIAFRIGWMFAPANLASAVQRLVKPLPMTKRTCALIAHEVGRERNQPLRSRLQPLWTARLVKQAKARSLAVLDAFADFMTLRLSKRIPIWLFEGRFGPSTKTTSAHKVFNAVRITADVSTRFAMRNAAHKSTGAVLRSNVSRAFAKRDWLRRPSRI
ncbi:MAG: aminotransferase class I/II-fold pyridoxal phosphate-dependent enzyme [Candidatus Hodgkinia cicadicola]